MFQHINICFRMSSMSVCPIIVSESIESVIQRSVSMSTLNIYICRAIVTQIMQDWLRIIHDFTNHVISTHVPPICTHWNRIFKLNLTSQGWWSTIMIPNTNYSILMITLNWIIQLCRLQLGGICRQDLHNSANVVLICGSNCCIFHDFNNNV